MDIRIFLSLGADYYFLFIYILINYIKDFILLFIFYSKFED